MRNTKNAFTLVELIVVITILAILGTIAFISLQGYSADARNSKRTSDLGNIQSAISLKQVEGVPLLSFVDTTASGALSGIKLAGSGAVAATDYKGGTPAYTVLNVAAKDFKDPSEKEYRIGATALAGGTFQVAATMEIDSVPTALVNGTFAPRATTDTATVSSVDHGTTTSIVTLNDSDANKFKAGDYITSGGVTAKILKVSRDGITLTIDATTGYAAAATVALQDNESLGLIADKSTATLAVENNKTTALPY